MGLLLETDVFNDTAIGGAKLDPPGSILGSYTNNTGADVLVVPWVYMEGLSISAASTITLYTNFNNGTGLFPAFQSQDYVQYLATISTFYGPSIPESSVPIYIPNGKAISIQCYSTNDLDQSVDGTVHFIDAQSGIDVTTVGGETPLSEPFECDVVKISGDTSAANNLELQYDGTGLTGNNFPSTQSAVTNISAGGGVPRII